MDANTGSFITLTDAEDWVKDFRTANPTFKKGFFIGKNKLNDLLNLTNCTGIAIYYAENASGDNTLVMTAVDDVDEEIYYQINGDDMVLDGVLPCPTDCPKGTLSGETGT